jgi:hypothetical protein
VTIQLALLKSSFQESNGWRVLVLNHHPDASRKQINQRMRRGGAATHQGTVLVSGSMILSGTRLLRSRRISTSGRVSPVVLSSGTT